VCPQRAEACVVRQRKAFDHEVRGTVMVCDATALI
jgi:hypothetical protein